MVNITELFAHALAIGTKPLSLRGLRYKAKLVFTYKR